MKSKISPLLLVTLFVFMSITVIADEPFNQSQNFIFKTKNENMFFSKTTIETKFDDYITISLDEANGYLMEEGKPILPICSKTFDFPFGTTIKTT